ncbi:MAG: hypothetical protein ACLRJC_12285 [Emergencia timonensis]|uniref:hypothetical protein n=1 Tax=Emergencia timonensis TaxID=1776384 RepID=UPI0008355C1D|nr:hypothetical protein [Emergencia timonensis]WNX86919.1 hypothetical protein RVY71_11765 [Emergencia timonensis]
MKKIMKSAVLKYILMYLAFILCICVYSFYKYGSFTAVDYDSWLIASAVFIAAITINEYRKKKDDVYKK